MHNIGSTSLFLYSSEIAKLRNMCSSFFLCMKCPIKNARWKNKFRTVPSPGGKTRPGSQEMHERGLQELTVLCFANSSSRLITAVHFIRGRPGVKSEPQAQKIKGFLKHIF